MLRYERQQGMGIEKRGKRMGIYEYEHTVVQTRSWLEPGSARVRHGKRTTISFVQVCVHVYVRYYVLIRILVGSLATPQ